jgi:hypothetical protein
VVKGRIRDFNIVELQVIAVIRKHLGGREQLLQRRGLGMSKERSERESRTHTHHRH